MAIADPVSPDPVGILQCVLRAALLGRYLGSMGAKVALFGGVLIAFLALSRRSKERAERRAMELFTERELSRPAPAPSPALQNGAGAPETGEATPVQPWRERTWQVGTFLICASSSGGCCGRAESVSISW